MDKERKERMQKIETIIHALQEGIEEKDEVIAVSLLAALAGQNTFLLGPPGTAKSLIARRLASVFETDAYFECLMQRFTTPEEVFGPISIKELKEDKYIRKTVGYLPEANFAFLDEIWKSSPAILNTLLTIINEKKFRNGDETVDVPLKAMIAASNEVPPPKQGLEALYDRFLVRLHVEPMSERENFEKVINRVSAKDKAWTEKITAEEFDQWQKEINGVKLSPEVLDVIQGIRIEVAKSNSKKSEQQIYISDRRWQRAARLLKAAAFFCDRTETNLVDVLLLRHCLWSDDGVDKRVLMKIVEGAVQENGVETGISCSDLDKDRNELEKAISEELFHDMDKYKSEKYIDGNRCIKGKIRVREMYYGGDGEDVNYYVSIDRISKDEEFHPIDADGKPIERIICNFGGEEKSFTVRASDRRREEVRQPRKQEWLEIETVSLIREYAKGDVKKRVSDRIFPSLTKDMNRLFHKINVTKKEVNNKRSDLEMYLNSPFVPEQTRKIAMESIDNQLAHIQELLESVDYLRGRIEYARK